MQCVLEQNFNTTSGVKYYCVPVLISERTFLEFRVGSMHHNLSDF